MKNSMFELKNRTFELKNRMFELKNWMFELKNCMFESKDNNEEWHIWILTRKTRHNILWEVPQIHFVLTRVFAIVLFFHSKFIANAKYMKEIAYLLFESRGKLETWFFSN